MFRILRAIKNSAFYLASMLVDKIMASIKDSTNIITTLKNLRATNLDLALYHLQTGNIKDAIFRLWIIDTFISKDDEEVKNLLGWSYYLRGNLKTSLNYFSLAAQNNENIIKFLSPNNSLEEIPFDIYVTYRNYQAQYFDSFFMDKSIYLPFKFANMCLPHLEKLPENSRILDLGSSTGLAAAELNALALGQLFKITAVEASGEMINYTNKNHENLYFKIYRSNLDNFLTENTTQYDVVLSFCSLSYKRNLTENIGKICSLLSTEGLAALCFEFSMGQTELNNKKSHFVYNKTELLSCILEKNNFILIHSEELCCNEKNYIIIICQKAVTKLA
jgi:predicted TPR repeat methyltransferase